MPTLYIVGTPIGNLEDVSLRALRILKEVGLIAAEDTRRTRLLLRAYDIRTPLTSYHEHNKLAKLEVLLGALREKDVALVSEAGMPGISDPGYELLKGALERGFAVVPVPGPSAVTAALAVAGPPAERFLHLGFLPRRAAQRRGLLRSVLYLPYTLVAFEVPHRLRDSLQDLAELCGERPLAICRELTKLHEEVFRGTPSQALEHFRAPRGEFTLVLEGSRAPAPPPDQTLLQEQLLRLRHQGFSAREAVAQVAQNSGLPRRTLYRLWVALP